MKEKCMYKRLCGALICIIAVFISTLMVFAGENDPSKPTDIINWESSYAEITDENVLTWHLILLDEYKDRDDIWIYNFEINKPNDWTVVYPQKTDREDATEWVGDYPLAEYGFNGEYSVRGYGYQTEDSSTNVVNLDSVRCKLNVTGLKEDTDNPTDDISKARVYGDSAKVFVGDNVHILIPVKDATSGIRTFVLTVYNLLDDETCEYGYSMNIDTNRNYSSVTESEDGYIFTMQFQKPGKYMLMNYWGTDYLDHNINRTIVDFYNPDENGIYQYTKDDNYAQYFDNITLNIHDNNERVLRIDDYDEDYSFNEDEENAELEVPYTCSDSNLGISFDWYKKKTDSEEDGWSLIENAHEKTLKLGKLTGNCEYKCRISASNGEILDVFFRVKVLFKTEHLTVLDEEEQLNADVRERLEEVFRNTFSDIWEYFHGGEICDVTVEVKRIESNPAYTSNRKITIDYNYANNNPDDIDFFTHELVHVAQMSDDGSYEADAWLVEGIADFGRDLFGMYNNKSGWSVQVPNSTDHYTDSYGYSAGFLKWIDTNKKKGFVKIINSKIQNGTYDIDQFKELTGSDIDALWNEYMTYLGKEVMEYDFSLPEITPIPDDVDISTYLTIVDNNNEFSPASKANINRVFSECYPRICEEYNCGKIIPVTLYADSQYDGLAYAVSEERKIVVNPDYLNKTEEDYDSITHELVHIVQNYQKAPDWLVEGIADYGRYQFGINNEKAGWFLPICAMRGDYEKGYRETATFLKWVADTYGKNSIRKIHELCKKYSYSALMWKEATGVGLGKLLDQYLKERKVPKLTRKVGETVDDIPYLNENDKVVHLSDYAGKPILLDFGPWDDSNVEEHMNDMLSYHKLYDNDLAIIIVAFNHSAESLKELLHKYYSEEEINTFTYLYDPGWKSTTFALGRDTGDGVKLAAPNKVFIDENMVLIAGRTQGCVYFPNTKPEDYDRYQEGQLYYSVAKKLANAGDTVGVQAGFLPVRFDFDVNGKRNGDGFAWDNEDADQYEIHITGSTWDDDSFEFISDNPEIISIETDEEDPSKAIMVRHKNGRTTIHVRAIAMDGAVYRDKSFMVDITNLGEDAEDHEHDWDDNYTIDVEPTCTVPGSKSIHCKSCDDKKDVQEIQANGHTFGEWQEIDTSICGGQSRKRICSVCGFEEIEESGESNHEWESDYTIDVAATCTSDGSKSIHCKNCDVVKDATVIPATGHEYGTPIFAWNKDDSACTATRKCKNDALHEDSMECTISENSVPATCTEDGYVEKTATIRIDGIAYQDKKIVSTSNATGHSWNNEYTIDKAATETEKGSKSIHCKNCSETKDVTEIPVIKKTSDASTQTPGETEKQSSGDDTKTSTGESKTEPEPVKTVITDTKTNAEIQVTSKSGQTPTAKYMGPADDDAESAVIPDVVKKGNVSYKITEVTKGAFSGSSVEKVTLGKNISKLQSGAFNGSNVNTIYIKSKKLTKKSVKGALKGCKAKNVKIVVKVGKKKDNQKYLNKYKKYFTKKNVGKRVTLKI